MSSPNGQISRLLSALSGKHNQRKLKSLGREFNSRVHDRTESAVFFVLQNVFDRLANALEGEAVSVERFEKLTAGIANQIADIPSSVQQGNRNIATLDRLVATLFRNLRLYPG
jgi:hypothetical protein